MGFPISPASGNVPAVADVGAEPCIISLGTMNVDTPGYSPDTLWEGTVVFLAANFVEWVSEENSLLFSMDGVYRIRGNFSHTPEILISADPIISYGVTITTSDMEDSSGFWVMPGMHFTQMGITESSRTVGWFDEAVINISSGGSVMLQPYIIYESESDSTSTATGVIQIERIADYVEPAP